MKIRVLFSNSFDCILCSVFHLAGFYTTEIKWMRVVGFFVRWLWLSRGKLCKNSREVVSLCNCIQIMLFLSLGLDAMMKKKTSNHSQEAPESEVIIRIALPICLLIGLFRELQCIFTP